MSNGPVFEHKGGTIGTIFRSPLRQDLCGCQRCWAERAPEREGTDFMARVPGPASPGWRYNCELCGNKRCPHHEWHGFICTGSNELGQVGKEL